MWFSSSANEVTLKNILQGYFISTGGKIYDKPSVREATLKQWVKNNYQSYDHNKTTKLVVNEP